MLSPFSNPMLYLLSVLLLSPLALSSSTEHFPRAAQNAIPKYPFDESTTRFCAWWLDNDGTATCRDIEQMYGVSMQDFQKWNPSIPIPCMALPANQSFCLAAYESPASRSSRGPIHPPSTATMTMTVSVPVKTTITQISTVISTNQVTKTALMTITPLPSPAAGTNGITTPVPYQPGMVTNCKTFHFVKKAETCVDIAARYRVSTDQIIAWNPYSRADCTRLLADTYCCVGVL